MANDLLSKRTREHAILNGPCLCVQNLGAEDCLLVTQLENVPVVQMDAKEATFGINASKHSKRLVQRTLNRRVGVGVCLPIASVVKYSHEDERVQWPRPYGFR